MSRMFKTIELGVWKPVPGFEDYLVSKDGQVLSLKKGFGWLMSPIKAKDGHLYVFLYDKQHQMCKKFVHDLILIAWCREPHEAEECRHLNDIPTDNRLRNLAWGTKKENGHDRVINGRTDRGERSPTHKLTEADVREIRQLVNKESLRSLAKRFGVSHTCIRRAATGIKWSYLEGVDNEPNVQNDN